MSSAAQRLADVVRDEGRRVLATLVRTTGSLTVAEDAVADAVETALRRWPETGVPDEPRAWLTTVARNKALDALRREAARTGKEAHAVELAALTAPDRPPPARAVRDDLLRLVFTCCHPALRPEAQVALALRTLCGLATADVARLLLIPEAASWSARMPDGRPEGSRWLAPRCRAGQEFSGGRASRRTVLARNADPLPSLPTPAPCPRRLICDPDLDAVDSEPRRISMWSDGAAGSLDPPDVQLRAAHSLQMPNHVRRPRARRAEDRQVAELRLPPRLRGGPAPRAQEQAGGRASSCQRHVGRAGLGVHHRDRHPVRAAQRPQAVRRGRPTRWVARGAPAHPPLLRSQLPVAAGVHIKVVQEHLGHSSFAITADIYSHVTTEQSREAADHLDRAVDWSRREDDGNTPAPSDGGLWR